MKTLTITAALSSLRLMDKKIDRKVSELNFIVAESGNTIAIGGKRVADVTQGVSAVKQAYQSVRDLMTERAKLKGAVVGSNAVTKVTIGERTMTVAEAIEYKQSINAEIAIQAQIKREITKLSRATETQERNIREKVERQVATILGNKKVIDPTDETFKAIDAQVRMADEVTYHDPLNINDLHDSLGDSIQDFMSNVDVALTVSNSTTTIEY